MCNGKSSDIGRQHKKEETKKKQNTAILYVGVHLIKDLKAV